MSRRDLEPGAGLRNASLTTADGRTLRYVTAGEGGPVVVFEAGLGAGAGEFVLTQRLVAQGTTAVAYDRAGHGGSSPDQQPRSLDRICEDLHALVQHVSPDRGVVLVGHSWGGPIVRCFAEKHPSLVAGIVMIDVTSTAVLPEKAAKSMPLTISIMSLLIPLTRPMVRRTYLKHVAADVSPEDREVMTREMVSKQSSRVAVAEARAASTSLPLLARWEEIGLPDHVPVITLAGAGFGFRKDVRAALITSAEEEMARHPRGECRVIEGTDHFVPMDKPGETAQAILDIVARVRAGSDRTQ